jgi:SAM-dependent methyltransferase
MTFHPSSKCRHCGTDLDLLVADLGATPVSNDYILAADRFAPERHYPLRAYCCRTCRLVQLEDFKKADELFREDYAYFSSVSSSWVAHASQYADAMSKRFGLSSTSTIVEVASNDGYLLQFFKAKSMQVLGVEPCKSVADYANHEKGINTRIEFFGEEVGRKLAAEGYQADLTAANNVLAHVPDINDFVAGFREILKPEGVATFEFPHLLNMIALNQFDTIYHEHFSYLSLIATKRILASQGLRVFDVEEINTHGGSLRLFACRADAAHPESPSVAAVMAKEEAAGLGEDAVYASFAARVVETKWKLLELLIDLKRQGKKIVGYGAPAKGNTLLNFCGVGHDFLDFTVDKSPQKQGMFLPGTRLDILAPEAIDAARPDYILILPWNIKDEVMEQLSHVRDWGCQFIVPIPVPAVI